MGSKKLKELFAGEKKTLKADVCFLIAIGVLLMLLGNSFFGGKNQKTDNSEDLKAQQDIDQGTKSPDELEDRMQSIFTKIEGAGDVKVMITYSAESEIVLAEEVKNDDNITNESTLSGDTRHIEQASTEKKAILLEHSDGSSSPIIVKKLFPAVEGIVIVAEGADNIIVKDGLIRCAEALLNVPAHKIAVIKMKTNN